MYGHQDKKHKNGDSVQSVIPLYYKIYEAIRRQIEKGDYPADNPLPGEHELANRFDVSRVTIRRTMQMLDEAGLITRLRGRGTFINPEAIRAIAPENYSGFDQNIKDFELSTKVSLIHVGYCDLPSWGIEAMTNRQGDTRVLGIEYTRTSDSVPFSHIRAYVPERIAKMLDVDSLGNKTVTTAIEETGTDVRVIDQKLTAIAADKTEAAILKVTIGHPLIRVRRVMFDVDRQCVQFVEAVYNPEHFEYHVSLSREPSISEAPRWVPASQ